MLLIKNVKKAFLFNVISRRTENYRMLYVYVPVEFTKQKIVLPYPIGDTSRQHVKWRKISSILCCDNTYMTIRELRELHDNFRGNV